MQELLIEQSEKFLREIKRARAYEAAKKITFCIEKRMEIQALIKDAQDQIEANIDSPSTVLGIERHINTLKADLDVILSEISQETKAALLFDKVLNLEFSLYSDELKQRG